MDKFIASIDPTTFTGSAFIIGILLTKELNIEEQDSIANWLQLVGLVIQTYASQVNLIESKNQTKKDENDLDALKKAIQKIQEKLNTL